jgi:hypothetical protein
MTTAKYKTLLIPLSFLSIAMLNLAGCYDPAGYSPEALKSKESKLWTNEQVDSIVEISYQTIDATERVTYEGAPEACNKIGFLRIRSKNGPGNAEQADAALLMVPGILEGAAAFEFIGRQMVYLAETEYGKHIEVWGMDRRSNCLEDLTGIEKAKKASSLNEAVELIANYYYENQPLNGKYFEGFKGSADLPILAEFGIRQTNLDIYDILHYMMPTPGVSKRKAFVGGHSLGGIHTSIFLAWDFDGDPETLDDAGYNLVAGAFGLETQVRPLDDGFFFGSGGTPTQLMKQLNITSAKTNAGFDTLLSALRDGRIPRNVDIPGAFTSEVIALPEFLGIAAAKAPDSESTLMARVPLSPAIQGVTKIIHPSSVPLTEFRYTNKAMVGIIFDDNVEPLNILQVGLGFLSGGPVKERPRASNTLPDMKYFVATDAGADLLHLHQGALYGWADRDQIGDAIDPDFMDLTGTVRFTYLENEPADMDDFIRALSSTPTNLTEWYFPVRILLDSTIAAKEFAPAYGINTYHHEGVANIDSFIANGSQGVNPAGELNAVPHQIMVEAPGYTHLDPMFEAVNSPSQPSYVIRPLLAFALEHAKP